MSKVLCWCCEYFLVNGEYGTKNGMCLKIPVMLSPYNEVCEEFIMKKGLHTERIIPVAKIITKVNDNKFAR